VFEVFLLCIRLTRDIIVCSSVVVEETSILEARGSVWKFRKRVVELKVC